MKKHISKLLIISVLLMLVGCNQQVETTTETTSSVAQTESTTEAEQTTQESELAAEKPVVYATIFPVYSLTQSIGGDLIDLKMAMPVGADPHDFEPSAKAMAEISDAALLVYNGLEIEAWIESSEDVLSESGLKLIEASENAELIDFTADHDHDADEEDHDHEGDMDEEDHDHEGDMDEEDHDHEGDMDEEDHDHEGDMDEEDHDHEGDADEEGHEHEHHHHHGDKDPHIWQSPKNALIMANNIYEGLKTVVPESKHDVLEQNYTTLVAELNALDQEMMETFKGTQRKEIVVGHAAFGYLADNYGLVQIPIAGLSTLDEPSPAALAEIVEVAKEHGVTTVFYDSLGSDKLAKVIADETGVEVKPLHTLGMVSQEMLDANKTYIGLMKENMSSLKAALND